ncbi:hypothetical protein QVD99_003140 [Batrachochytrium dendrobatidis]|nr:hypothetical protein O5D80_001697 [Batrachochytrium dendrobatidis]KAK5670458.1 hypothetical protein QVD99_003140 [Batrachochytrium dendrobatidis]
MDGFQYKFVQSPSASLLCPICQDVYLDPVITNGCHHSFCLNCINQSLELEQQCPLCRGRLSQRDLHPNLALSGLVGELLVFCAYFDDGCMEHLRMDSYASHLKHCNYSPQKCSSYIHGCEFKGSATSVDLHQQSCPYQRLNPFILAVEKRISDLESLVHAQSAQINSLLLANPLAQSVKTNSVTIKPSENTRVHLDYLSDRTHEMPDIIDPWPNGDILCKNTISSGRSGVTSVAYAGDKLYVGAYDGKIRSYIMKSGELLDSVDGHSLSVWSLAVDPSRKQIYSSGTDGFIKAWNIQDNGKLVLAGLIQADHGKVYSLVMYGEFLVSASSDKTIRLWNRHTLECTGTLVGHEAGVNAICLLPHDQLASVSSDKSIKIWDLNTCQTTGHISHLPSDALDVTFGSGMLFASTLDANITAYDLNSYLRAGQMTGHRWEVWQLKYTSNVLFSGSHDHTIKRWDIRSFRSTADLTGHKGYIHSLATGAGCLISGCGDKTVKVWGAFTTE